MHFAYPLPWWAFVLLVVVTALVGAAAYGVSLRGREARSRKRLTLAGLRAASLLLLLFVLFRPLIVASQRNPRGVVVPILVDQSRSMQIADVDGGRRIDVAVDRLKHALLPRLTGHFQPQIYGFGETVSPSGADALSSPEQRRTDLGRALGAMADRYRDQPVAGIIVLSDGGTTDANVTSPVPLAPVFAVGIGGALPDREVKSVTASNSTLAASLVDIDASIVSRGFGSQPFDVRLIAYNEAGGGRREAEGGGRKAEGGRREAGTAVDVQHVAPADGVPVQVRFEVPVSSESKVYSVEIPFDAREAVRENNSASVLVTPPGRRRRILFVEGAPGFEHSFLRRAWDADPAIEVDSVVRKGRNEQGQDAFLVQADPARGPALMTGYPTTRAGLFTYDAIVFGNVEWDFLTRDQLAMTADFVRERGGGVLVLGARSFASHGLNGTPLEDALPLPLVSGRASVALTGTSTGEATGTAGAGGGENKLRLTNDGQDATIMRVTASADDNDREWAALPPLAAVNILGAPKPGASILAVAGVGGTARPVLAVQRYGRGRTAEFAGEGSWRWKMLMPAGDRTHELFWRQVIRWLSSDAPDQITIGPVQGAQPGVPLRLDVLAADNEYHPAVNASVTLRVTAPDGQTSVTNASLADQTSGRYSAPVTPDRSGMYRVEAEARQGSQLLGTAQQVFLAGGADPEFADPRLNEAALQRIATETGGRYLPVRDVATLPDLLKESADSVTVAVQPRDLWQHPLAFAAIAMLLGAEWILRRKRGWA